MQHQHRFSLEPYAGKKSRHNCPGCGERSQFTRYIDNATGNYLADKVGMCNRANNCGYHYTPSQYFRDTGLRPEPTEPAPVQKQAEKAVDHIQQDFLAQTLDLRLKSSFCAYLKGLFGEGLATEATKAYFIGRSNRDNGTANIFWQIDISTRVRTGKIMCYDHVTGKRKKGDGFHPTWVHTSFGKQFNYRQCLFGEHLLMEYPGKPVALVESEKTAIICCIYMPQYNWLSTGGMFGAKWAEYETYQHFSGRRVVLFPDHGYSNAKTGKTCHMLWSEAASHIRERVQCKISVSNILKDNLDGGMLSKGYDMADFIVNRDPASGHAVDSNGRPIMHTMPLDEWKHIFQGGKQNQKHI